MSNEGAEIVVSNEKKTPSRFEQLKRWALGKAPTTKEQSDRFEKLGYLKYPMRQQLDYRLFALEGSLQGIEKEYREVYEARKTLIKKLEIATTDEEKTHLKEVLEFTDNVVMRDLKQKAIDQLADTFELMGGPWFKGLDKPRLSKKMLAFQKIISAYGEVPAIYKVLRYGTHVLLNLSWAKEDVEPETPVLMETRTTIQREDRGAPTDKTDSLGASMLTREIRSLKDKIKKIEEQKTQ